MQVSCSFYSWKLSMQQKEAEKREVLKRQGHGEYREITEGDFLGEVTGSEKVICHFYHHEFYRCKYGITYVLVFWDIVLLLVLKEIIFCEYLLGSWINIWRPLPQSMWEQNSSSLMLKSVYYHLAIYYFLLRTLKPNVIYNLLQNSPFFVAKLAIKTLPCVILFK